MICFPLDNMPYEAKDMGTYLATRTRGVFSSDGNLAVTPGESGLSVSVSPGLAWLKWSDFWGVAALQAQALTLDLDTADGALKRIDAIVCRLDKVNNLAEIVVKKGSFSSSPVLLPPVRDTNYDELYIATILIDAGIVSISASAITDQRLNEEYCGLMRDGVTGIPTASLHAQAQQILTELTDALNAQIVRQSAEFDAWFDDLKGKLGEDPATALQQQVDNLNAAVVGDAFQASGTPVSIAYAGTQRIASITAYGETPQGGTTEAPVALTGISSVTVNDDVTELPIPRPLHKVGDVRDVCQTRVKSVYDKRVVLDGTEIWTKYTDENWQGAGYHVYRFYDADALPSQYIVSNKYPSRRGASNFKGTLGVTSGLQSILFSVVEQKTVDDWKAYLAAQKAAGTPIIIYRQSTAYDGTNGLDVCLTEYQTDYIESYADESITTAWISSTGALSTGAEVAYVLSSPETYATDPLDIDNAAGPLTVLTGGAVEVRMTELVGSRSPEIVAKMDKATYDADGDGVVDRAADSVKLAGLTPIIDNPSSTNNRNTWYFPFTGTNNKDGTRKYYAALYADEATRAANKVGGGALVDTNDGRLSNARRASNITMGYDGNLWISYS